jgi:hypothetical protein
VTITGTNLSGATTVSFGMSSGNVTADSATSVTATAPAGSVGAVDVTVTTPGGTSATSSADTFTYVAAPPPAPTVTGVNPTSGSTDGGATVTITGTNLAGATAVQFGKTTATVSADSATSVTATAPTGSAGAVDVTVTTPGGTSATSSADTFTYVTAPPPAPSVTGVNPTSGTTLGGTPVTITGTNLSGVTAVLFGMTTGTVTADSSSSITTTAPAGSAGTVDVTVTTSGGTSATSSADSYTYVTPIAPGGAGVYVPLAPVRICDSRVGNPSNLSGASTQCNGGTSNPGSTIAAGGTKNINVAGAFGIPADATAVVLNVTVANPASGGFLTVFPTGAARPLASNINYATGKVVPNLVEVGIGTGGQVSFYSLSRTDIVVDVEGYVSSSSPIGAGAGLYKPLSTPARICDTRAGNPSQLNGGAAQCNGGASNPGTRLTAGGSISVQVTGNAAIPAGATAAVLNVTAVASSAQGYLTVYPHGASQPTASNVNYTPGQTSANRVIVPLSSSGAVSIYSSASSDVVVDVSGYYTAAGGAGTEFTAEAAPVRICDTRPGNPSGLSGSDNQCLGRTDGSADTLTFQVTGLADVPADAKAVVINLTGIDPSAPTFLTVYPGPGRPFASDLNPAVETVRANLTVATLSSAGTVTIYNNSGSLNVAVDVLGWYS